MKKRLLLEAISLLILTAIIVVFAIYTQNKTASQMEVFYFYSPDCPNCKAVKPFIESLKDELKKKKTKFVELNIKEHDRWNPLYKILAGKISQKLKTDFIPLPTAVVRHRGRFFTFIGKDDVLNLNDFFHLHAGTKRLAAKLDK